MEARLRAQLKQHRRVSRKLRDDVGSTGSRKRTPSKPAWNSEIHDLSVYKLTPAEVVRCAHRSVATDRSLVISRWPRVPGWPAAPPQG